jgi:hypothetical protein
LPSAACTLTLPVRASNRLNTLCCQIVVFNFSLCWIRISGKASYYYTQPYSWQFCVIYADYTAQLWQQKFVDGVPTMLSYLGILNMFYSW